MKKIVLFTVTMFVFSHSLLFAQTNKGNVLIGVSSTLSLAGTGSDVMNFGYSTIRYKSNADGFNSPGSEKLISLNLLPKSAYFVDDNLALGLGLNVAYSINKDSDDKYSKTLFSAEPFVRYYIPTSRVLPFFELNGSLGTLRSKLEYKSYNGWEESKSKASVYTLGAGIGLAAPISERITFDILAGYNSMTIKEKDDNENNERTIIGTIGLKMGFTFILGAVE